VRLYRTGIAEVAVAVGAADLSERSNYVGDAKMKPTPADIIIAIGKVQAGDWIDPTDRRALFSCRLFDPTGRCVGDGDAYTAGEAMALAWIHVHAPDALWKGRVELGEVPYEGPEGWRFEVTPAP